MKELLKALDELFKIFNDKHTQYHSRESFIMTSRARKEIFGKMHWEDVVGKPFGALILKKLNYSFGEISGPSGLGAQLIVKSKRGKSITLEPSLTKNTFYVTDYNTITDTYGSGTIGAMNGMNNGHVDIRTIKTLKQLKRLVG